MAFPEAWPVATSRGDFTAAAAWFCFSFDCFSLVCATATSDKHANPNTKILLFILFSPMCGERTTLALSIRAPDKLSPLQTQRCCALAPGPASYRGTGWPCGAGALARENSIDAAASVPLVRFRKGAASESALSGAEGRQPPPSCHSEGAAAPRTLHCTC